MNTIELRDHPIHGEYPVGSDQLLPGSSGLRLLQPGFKIGQIVVIIAIALRLAEPDSINDGGVIETVGNDGILGGEERLKKTSIGVKTGGIEDGVFGAQKSSDGLLQLAVHALAATDEPHRRRPEPPALQGCTRCFHHLGMVSQAQVIVGAHVEDFTPVLQRDEGTL